MPAIPWKVRQSRSRHDRLDRLSVENNQLKRKVSRIHVDTLREIRRRIERDDQLTLKRLQAELTERIARVEEDSVDALTVGKERFSSKL